jgi:hypothetical protein
MFSQFEIERQFGNQEKREQFSLIVLATQCQVIQQNGESTFESNAEYK